MNRGLKTSSTFNSGTSRTETYTYDPKLDYLAGANYADDQPNPTPTWTYDGAGNRANANVSYDDLNRMMKPDNTPLTDVLGNRTADPAGTTYPKTYTWDSLSRLIGLSASNFMASYEYRVDGLRTTKTVTTTSAVIDSYRYDGQMPFEDETINGNAYTAVRGVLGARGADAEETVRGTITTGIRTPQTDTMAYPIYDAHGNRICTLSRYQTGNFTTDTPRYYGAWGEVRQGAGTGGSVWRYCASLGHVSDDESGLIYMRARYYEPGSGRFANEDSKRNGNNWDEYCSNDPVNHTDHSGCFSESERELIGFIEFAIGLITMTLGVVFPDPSTAIAQILEGQLACQVFLVNFGTEWAQEVSNAASGLYRRPDLMAALKNSWRITGNIDNAQVAIGGIAGRAIAAMIGYAEMVQGEGVYLGVFG